MSLLESQLTAREKELRLVIECLLNEMSAYVELIKDGKFPYPVDETFNMAKGYGSKSIEHIHKFISMVKADNCIIPDHAFNPYNPMAGVCVTLT